MKLKVKPFYPPDRMAVVKPKVPADLYRLKKFKMDKMCMNCNKYVWNKFTRDTFCAKHKTPIEYFELCAYFFPTWSKEI